MIKVMYRYNSKCVVLASQIRLSWSNWEDISFSHCCRLYKGNHMVFWTIDLNLTPIYRQKMQQKFKEFWVSYQPHGWKIILDIQFNIQLLSLSNLYIYALQYFYHCEWKNVNWFINISPSPLIVRRLTFGVGWVKVSH